MVLEVLLKMITYFGNDIRRINHALKVYGFAKTISENEKISDEKLMTVEFAAILHDIGIKEAERKYNSSAGRYQELEGPPIALELISQEGIDKPIIERVCYLIGNHHSYAKIDGIDFQILVEADFLVNIDEDALDAEAILQIRNKYFKTDTGISILKSLYGV
jgi:CRISPR/Cas system-associated endonuclease Cas3-HD